MGLLVHTTFETEQGIPVTNVYVRISSVTADFVNGAARVTIKCESHVSREKRLEQKRPLYVPNIPTYFSAETPLDSGWNDISFLYSSVKSQMLAAGFEVVEDVNPDPAPAPAPEPTPEETTPA
jgi:hypothetical protein